MLEDNELEQMRLKKIQDMLDQTKNQKQPNKEPITITDGTFLSTIQSHELLVVDFWAPWCGPCRMMGPIIDMLAAEYAGKVTFGKMNTDENKMVPSNLEIMSIPTVIVFHHGKTVERIVGAYPKTYIETIIKKYL
jgi:thioredoxin 1